MTIILRDYQNELIERVRKAFGEKHRSILLQLPTGGGKTLTAAYIMKAAAERGNRTLFLCNRRELVEQTVAAFAKIGVTAGVIAAGKKPNYDLFVQVGSIDTLRARMDDVLYFPDLVIWDEARGIAAKSWAKIKEHYASCYHIGLDATPQRLDRKPLRPYFSEMIQGPSIQELIERGSLVAPRLYVPPTRPDLSQVKIVRGDYDSEQLAGVMSSSAITGDIISHYKRLANNGQGLVFCPTIDYSMMIADLFKQNGIPCEHLDGNTSTKVRKIIVDKYKRHEINLLTNVNLFTAGFDVPNVSYIADASPTKSLANYMQRAGRAARPSDGKEYYTLSDHAGNSFIHGMPHEDRVWSLDAKPKRTNSAVSVAPVKQCEECYACSPISSRTCVVCGHEFPKTERETKTSDDDLVEVKHPPKLFGKALQDAIEACNTPGDLHALAKRQGYRAGWCYHIMKARKLKSGNPLSDNPAPIIAPNHADTAPAEFAEIPYDL